MARKWTIEEKRAYQNAWNRANRDKVNATKKRHLQKIDKYILNAKSGGCSHCTENDPVCLAFHHRDRSTKTETVARLRRLSFDKVKIEIDKCDVLCHNCHAKLHYQQRMDQ